MSLLADLLVEKAYEFGDRIAVTDPRGRSALSYAQLHHEVTEAVQWIQARIAPNQPVLFLPGDTPQDLAFLLAAVISHAVPLIGDKVWTDHEVTTLVANTGAVAIISSDRNHTATGQPVPSPVADLTDIDFARFTSGSSGPPRCLGFTERALLHAGRSWSDGAGIHGDDIVMCLATLNNGLAFNTSIVPVLEVGATLVLPGLRLLPSLLVKAIQQTQPTILVAFPFVYEALTREPPAGLASLRLLISSAAPLTTSISDHWKATLGLDICNYYGLAEVGPVTFNRGAIPGSLGEPLLGAELRLTSAASPDSATDTDRILVRTGSMAERFIDCLQPDFQSRLDIDGFFATQDAGHLVDGSLIVTGRLDNIINLAGRKFDPQQVRQVLLSCEAVSDAVVRMESVEGQPTLTAYIESASVAKSQIIAHCRNQLAPYKIPQRWRIVERLPRSSAGKILADRLNQMGSIAQ